MPQYINRIKLEQWLDNKWHEKQKEYENVKQQPDVPMEKAKKLWYLQGQKELLKEIEKLLQEGFGVI